MYVIIRKNDDSQLFDDSQYLHINHVTVDTKQDENIAGKSQGL